MALARRYGLPQATRAIRRTCFPAIRVASNREGSVSALTGRLNNLARLRVVVR